MSLRFNNLMLGSIELFCLTAELECFSAAATTAGLSPAAVSRSVSRLEARLGVQLFVRTTRRVRLTDSGRSYFEQCRRALALLVEAEREVSGEQCAPTGTVRISLPTSYGHFRVLPLLARFRQLHPGIELDVQLSNRNVDFTAEGFDMAVRGRAPPDSGLIARKLEDAALVVVASPAYLQGRGVPQTLPDIAQHECIQFMLPSTGQPVPWTLRQGGHDIELSTLGGVRCTDDILGPVTLAVGGAGLLQTYRFIVEQDLAQGRLCEVLGDFAGASRPFSLLYPANRYMPRRVRLLIDFLVAQLGNPTPQADTRAV